MRGTQTFDPKPASEKRVLEFPFDAGSGSVTLGAASCSVWSGIDPSPSALITSVSSDASTVFVTVDGGVEGCIYLLRATADTNVGERLVAEGFLAVKGAA